MSDTRFDIDRRKQDAALVSVAVKVGLTICKFVAAALSGSLALLSEAGNNLSDVGVTLLSFYAIRIAAKPADEDHPYGHGKVEALAALVQTGFLFALAVFIVIEAARRLYAGGPQIEAGVFAFGVLVVSIVVDAWRWCTLNKVAKATRSPALAADALNFATDIVASTMAICGLLATLYGFAMGDAIAALGVALFVAIAGWRLGRETVGNLIDTAPKGLGGRIRRLVDDLPGVISVDAVRLRPIGSDIVGDVSINVSRTLSIDRVSLIRKAVADAVERAHPEVKVTVTADPIALDDETVVERVLYTANRRRVPIHHVTVQSIDAIRSVSFDAEVDGRMPLGRAHEIVTALETAVADELGEGIEVECHIEPLDVSELESHECSGAVRDEVRTALARHITGCGAIFDVHDVRVRETTAGLVVNYHCLVDPDVPVETVHQCVDALDRQVRLDCAAITRIVGHAEPAKAKNHDKTHHHG